MCLKKELENENSPTMQDEVTDIKERRLQMQKSGKWTDCRFLVGSKTQCMIAGHKLILAMASPVFESMFFGNLTEITDPIVIPDVHSNAFQCMLEYIYADRLSVDSLDKAWDLCYLAKKYMLPHIVEQCVQFMCSNLNPKTACRIYGFAKLFEESRLMESSMEIITANTFEILSDPSFAEVEITTLMSILDQDNLNIESELDLFGGILKYATGHGLLSESHDATISANVELPLNSEVVHNPSHIMAVDGIKQESKSNATCEVKQLTIDEPLLRQAVKKIRFLTLSPQQFAEGPARSKLLQQPEILAILVNISSPFVNDSPMPEGFSSSRDSRKKQERQNNIVNTTAAKIASVASKFFYKIN